MMKCPPQTDLSILIVCLIFLSAAAGQRPTWSDIYHKKTPIAAGWKTIIIHHSATESGSAGSFHRYHEKMGYGGLCYHFVIGNGRGAADGAIQTGFRWKDQMIGTHVDINSWYHNIFGIGICLVGNLDRRAPTPKQMAALTALVKRLMKVEQIPLDKVLPHNRVPHGEIRWDAHRISVTLKEDRFAATSCPGKRFPFERWKATLQEVQ
jgi:N-acetyl-anhydromuramyl-L-alanine amidase AmpD